MWLHKMQHQQPQAIFRTKPPLFPTQRAMCCPQRPPIPSLPNTGSVLSKSATRPKLVLLYTIIALQKCCLDRPNGFLRGRAQLVPQAVARGPAMAAGDCRGTPVPPCPPSLGLSKRSFFPNANPNKHKYP